MSMGLDYHRFARAASARLAAQPNVVYVEPDRILAAQIR